MDTICAISTAPGVGGIGIVRISGNEAINFIRKIFISSRDKDLDEVNSHTLNYGYIIDPQSKEKIDEVLVSVMRAPNTYTKEDVVEINCHGGVVVVKKIMEACLDLGCRLAEPGEFTKRAFLNGRLDLTQSEAVIDIINSKTILGAEQAFNQLEGSLFKKITEFKQKIVSLMAHVEATIDFPEYDIEEITFEKLRNQLQNLIREVKQLIDNSEKGKIIREGLNTAIVGKPNVGKSSLLNMLTGEKRAIVTEIPGTTRDTIEEYINISGIPLKIIDTAGIRETEDIVEKIGVEKSKEVIDKADLVIFILDNSEALSENDIIIAERIKNKKVIVVINKIDLDSKLDENKIKEVLPNKEYIKISLKEGIFVEKIEKSIEEMFFKGQFNIHNELLITNIRHKDLLQKCYNSLIEAQNGLEDNMPIDCISIDLKNGLEYLGNITGESVNEDIIHEIFKQFCIGK